MIPAIDRLLRAKLKPRGSWASPLTNITSSWATTRQRAQISWATTPLKWRFARPA